MISQPYQLMARLVRLKVVRRDDPVAKRATASVTTGMYISEITIHEIQKITFSKTVITLEVITRAWKSLKGSPVLQTSIAAGGASP